MDKSYSMEPIDSRYNEEMISVIRASPINAEGLSVYFDKSPDVFKISRMKYSTNHHLGFFQNGELKGFGSLGYYDALVHGQKETVFTFYNFYILPEARGKNLPAMAMEQHFGSVRKEGLNYGIGITMKGNRAAESYIGKKPGEWMPYTRVIDELAVKSILFSRRIRNQTKYIVRQASLEDIPAIVKRLQEEHAQRDFGLIFTPENFMASLIQRDLAIENYYVATGTTGAIEGVCLAWDCSAFRRTTIEKYSGEFFFNRLAYKMAEWVLPLAPFPENGKYFRELSITDYATARRDPEIMHALLCEIYFRNHNRTYHMMNWASCGSDPLLVAAKGFWQKQVTSHILFTSMDPERLNIKTRLPYIDIAFI